VERWKREEFPAIREQARRRGATIYFADEAGVRSDYHAGTTWAPVGRTPVVRTTGGPALDQPGLRGHRTRRAAVRRLRGEVHLRGIHRLL
jgi:hypothetical protein